MVFAKGIVEAKPVVHNERLTFSSQFATNMVCECFSGVTSESSTFVRQGPPSCFYSHVEIEWGDLAFYGIIATLLTSNLPGKVKGNMEQKARLIYGSTYAEGEISNMDLRWLIGMRLPDPHFFIEFGDSDEERFLLASPLEAGRAENEAKHCKVISLGEEKAIPVIVRLMEEHGVSTLILHPQTPIEIYEELEEKGINDIEVGKYPWYPKRMVKTEEEVNWILEVQGKIEEVLYLCFERLQRAEIQDGIVTESGAALTSEIMRKFIELELYQRDCASIDTIVSSGKQSAFPHKFGSGPLKAHVPIVFDIYPYSRTTGYFADMTRTGFKGKPTASVMWMYGIVLEGQKKGIAKVKAGADGYDIHKEIEDFFDRKGFRTDRKKGFGFTHGTGHGFDLRVHALHWISRHHEILEKGAVVTVEPGLYYPEEEAGIRIEDMVLVEENGCRNLTKFPKDLKSMVIA